MHRVLIVLTFAIRGLGGGPELGKRTHVNVSPDMEHVVTALRGACAAFNRGDMTAAVEPLDGQIEWTESAEFPGGGTDHGQDGVRQHPTQSRAARAGVDSEPERYIIAGNRMVVLVHARVRPKGSNHGQDASPADVYTVCNGRVVEMQALADRREALRWLGAEAERDR